MKQMDVFVTKPCKGRVGSTETVRDVLLKVCFERVRALYMCCDVF